MYLISDLIIQTKRVLENLSIAQPNNYNPLGIDRHNHGHIPNDFNINTKFL